MMTKFEVYYLEGQKSIDAFRFGNSVMDSMLDENRTDIMNSYFDRDGHYENKSNVTVEGLDNADYEKVCEIEINGIKEGLLREEDALEEILEKIYTFTNKNNDEIFDGLVEDSTVLHNLIPGSHTVDIDFKKKDEYGELSFTTFRSMDIGDIVVIDKGEAYMCLPRGWKRIDFSTFIANSL